MTTWRVSVGVMALFMAVLATAQVSQSLIDREVELRVQQTELRVLRNSGQIDSAEYSRRNKPLDQESKTILKSLSKQVPSTEYRTITDQISAQTKARVAVLEPQWQAQADAFKQAEAERKAQLKEDLEADARKALEYQREQMRATQQQAAGTITQAELQRRQSEALTAIMKLREKYAQEGTAWGRDFDNRVKLLTGALDGNPDTVLPGYSVTENDAPLDFDADVKRAADLLVQQAENSFKYEAKQISSDTYREGDIVFSKDRNALRLRYPERNAEFEKAVKAASSTRIAELRAQYKGTPPPIKSVPVTPVKKETPIKDAFYAILFFAIVGGVIWIVYRWIKNLGNDFEEEPPVSTIYGTARFGQPAFDIPNPVVTFTGVFFGRHYCTQGAPVYSAPKNHSLIVAPTRTGKGTRVIVPTLLRCKYSMLVVDPKGENAAITARIRRFDHDNLPSKAVHIVNPWGMLSDAYAKMGFTSATYNPLDVLDRNDPNIVSLAQSLAATISPASAGDKDSYWRSSAAGLLTGVLLWITDHPTETKTLARLRQIVTMTRQKLKDEFLIKMSASEAFGGAISEAASPFIDMADDTYSGILSNVVEATKFLSDPQIKTSTATSSFSMKDLIDNLTTVYLVIPPELIETQRTWLRLMIAATTHTFKRHWRGNDAALRCLFMIDEFAALGKLDDIPRDIAMMSGHGVDYALIIQGLNQLKANYGDDGAATILSNCSYKWFSNVNDLETAKYVSDSLGQMTVRTTSKSESTTPSQNGTSTSTSTNYSETGRLLLMPDEVMHMGRGQAILFNPQDRPMLLQPIDYWNLKKAFDHLKEKHPMIYWQPPLKFDVNPYVSG